MILSGVDLVHINESKFTASVIQPHIKVIVSKKLGNHTYILWSIAYFTIEHNRFIIFYFIF